MKIMKQYKIDEGQIGGLITIFTQSMFIFSIMTFLNTSALVYQSILKYYISIYMFLTLIVIGSVIWMGFYYSILLPSMVRFGNRQNYVHGNPIVRDIKSIIQELREQREEIKELKTKIEEIKNKN